MNKIKIFQFNLVSSRFVNDIIIFFKFWLKGIDIFKEGL